jgi:hypothetical protein
MANCQIDLNRSAFDVLILCEDGSWGNRDSRTEANAGRGVQASGCPRREGGDEVKGILERTIDEVDARGPGLTQGPQRKHNFTVSPAQITDTETATWHKAILWRPRSVNASTLSRGESAGGFCIAAPVQS